MDIVTEARNLIGELIASSKRIEEAIAYRQAQTQIRQLSGHTLVAADGSAVIDLGAPPLGSIWRLQNLCVTLSSGGAAGIVRAYFDNVDDTRKFFTYETGDSENFAQPIVFHPDRRLIIGFTGQTAGENVVATAQVEVDTVPASYARSGREASPIATPEIDAHPDAPYFPTDATPRESDHDTR